MRLSSIFTLLCALAALILLLLCLFAGSNRSFLQNGDILTVNVSRIGHTQVFNTSDGNGGFFSNIVNTIEGDINKLVNDITSDIAHSFNLSDYYTAHIMNFCEGYYEPNTTAKHISDNVTHCSSNKALFSFDPTKIVQDSLPKGITLDDIHWPQEVEDTTHAVKSASVALFVFYILGIVFAGLAVIGAAVGIFTSGRLSALLNCVIDVLAFLCLGIASAMVTAVMIKAVNTINKYGAEIGVAAYKGVSFLGMTWAATAVMLLACIMSAAQVVAGCKHSRRVGEKTME